MKRSPSRPGFGRRGIALASLVLATQALVGCPRFQERAGPTFAPARFYTQVGRDRIFVKERGQKHAGPALLLIHGYGSAHDAWELIAPRLAKHYRVLSIDLPGFGRSDKYEGDYSPAGLAKKLLALLNKKGVRQAHLIAHSWGSSIALAMALQAPQRIRSLTLMGAWVFEDQLPSFIRWARIPVIGEALYAAFYDQRLDDRMALAFYQPEPFVQPQVIDAVRRQLGRPGSIRAALQAARQQRFTALERRYKTIKQPSLLLWGRQDRVSLPNYGHRLDKVLPSSEMFVFEQCGHIPAMERPKAVLRHLLPFLARHHVKPRLVAARKPAVAQPPQASSRPAPAATTVRP